jgi:hypothetical protein
MIDQLHTIATLYLTEAPGTNCISAYWAKKPSSMQWQRKNIVVPIKK